MSYQITDWFNRYEVNKDGRVAKKGEGLRAGSLPFIRSKVSGRKLGTGFRRLAKICGKSRLYATFGVFHKLLEIAADVSRELRDGTLYNEHDQPATIEELAFIMNCPISTLTFALKALIKVGWLIEINNLADFAENSEARGKAPSTQLNSTQLNSDIEEEEEEEKTAAKITFSFEDKSFKKITPEDINRWGDAYPAVDITGEIKRAAEWLISNPAKRKSNYRRYLTNWFGRTQEKGGTKGRNNGRKISREFTGTSAIGEIIQA